MSCHPQSYTKEEFSSPPFFLSFLACCKRKTEREGDTKSGLCKMGLVTVFRQQGSKYRVMWGAELCACVFVVGSAYPVANSGVSCQAQVT